MSVAAIILAAGMSTRMGANKLLQDVGGELLISRVVRNVEASRAHPIVVVLGHQAIEVDRVLPRLRHGTAYNSAFADGLASSIRSGVNWLSWFYAPGGSDRADLSCLPDDCTGALIVLGDMPAISSSLIDRMIDVFGANGARAICVAAHNGRRGNPVLFGRHYFPELLELEGDTGARRIVAENAAHVVELDAGDESPFIDIDTPDALTAFCTRVQ